MAYETYTTQALVCGTFNRNTADRNYQLFTQEAGMLYATARSVREERSRQRYALQDFSLVRVSLVKGKHGWRVGSIEPVRNYYQEALDKAARGSVVRVFRVLRRFVAGEEADPTLFTYVDQSLSVLVETVEYRPFVELVVLVHLLGQLGYVDAKKIPPAVCDSTPQQIESTFDSSTQAVLEKLYTHAITVSHL